MPTLKARPKKTLEDLERLPPETRAELIEGEIFMAPAPNVQHQRIVFRLARALAAWVEPRGLGEVLVSPIDVRLPSGSLVQPDIVFVATANRRILAQRVEGAPDLLIEVVSPAHADRDRIVKRGLYAKNRIVEYWIADGDARAIEVLRLADGDYEPAGYFQASDTLTTALLPGFTLPVAPIMADA